MTQRQPHLKGALVNTAEKEFSCIHFHKINQDMQNPPKTTIITIFAQKRSQSIENKTIKKQDSKQKSTPKNNLSVCRVYEECINSVCQKYGRGIPKVSQIY